MTSIAAFKNEDELFSCLSRCLDGDFSLAGQQIDFSSFDWLSFSLLVKGKEYNSTINEDLMEGLISYQRHIYKVAAIILYGSGDSRRLPKEVKEKLKVDFKVSKGSSDIWASLTEVGKEFVAKCTDKMSGTQLTAVSIVAVICVCTTYGIVHHIDAQKDIAYHRDLISLEAKSVDGMRSVSEKNSEIILRAMDKFPQIKEIVSISDDAAADVISSVSGADEVIIQRRQIPYELLRSSRKKIKEDIEEVPHERIEDTFTLKASKVLTSDRGFSFTAISEDKNKSIPVVLPPYLPKEEQDAVFNAYKEKQSIFLSIMAAKVGEKYKDGYISAVSESK